MTASTALDMTETLVASTFDLISFRYEKMKTLSNMSKVSQNKKEKTADADDATCMMMDIMISE